jgi:putative transposase
MYYRWRNQFGGMKAEDVKRLKELEAENARLKRIVADQALNIAALNEVSRGRMKVKSVLARFFARQLAASR